MRTSRSVLARLHRPSFRAGLGNQLGHGGLPPWLGLRPSMHIASSFDLRGNRGTRRANGLLSVATAVTHLISLSRLFSSLDFIGPFEVADGQAGFWIRLLVGHGEGVVFEFDGLGRLGTGHVNGEAENADVFVSNDEIGKLTGLKFGIRVVASVFADFDINGMDGADLFVCFIFGNFSLGGLAAF